MTPKGSRRSTASGPAQVGREATPALHPAEALPWGNDQSLSLTPKQAEEVVRLVEAAQAVWRRHQFFVWCQSQLHPLIPHHVMVCGAYQRQRLAVRFDVFQSVVLSPELLGLFGDGSSALMRATISSWVQGRGRPQLLDAARLVGEARNQALRLRQETGIDQWLVHGVSRPQRPTEIESLFIFAGVQTDAARGHPQLHAELLMPYLHSTWRRVLAAESELAGSAVERVIPELPVRGASASTTAGRLTERERQILLSAREGHSNQQIGDLLGISPLTVKNHIQKILRKLGASNRAHAVALAMTQDLLGATAPRY
jgi:transcriptional regulator EpsA